MRLHFFNWFRLILLSNFERSWETDTFLIIWWITRTSIETFCNIINSLLPLLINWMRPGWIKVFISFKQQQQQKFWPQTFEQFISCACSIDWEKMTCAFWVFLWICQYHILSNQFKCLTTCCLKYHKSWAKSLKKLESEHKSFNSSWLLSLGRI